MIERHQADRHSRAAEERDRAQERERTAGLSTRETETLREVQRFRIVGVSALAQSRYPGRSSEMRGDLDRLVRHKLVYRHTVVDFRGNGQKLEVLTLTPKLQKPREVYHDAAIYEAYQKAASKLTAEGATVQNVRTDHEMKGQKARLQNKGTEKRGPNGQLDAREKEALAAAMHLKVVNGKIPIPDLQVHYRDRDGQERVLNLEVTTDTYRGRDTGPKAAAGFSMSKASGSSSASGRAGAVIRDDHHLWRN